MPVSSSIAAHKRRMSCSKRVNPRRLLRITRAGGFVFVTGQVATKPGEKLQLEKPLEGSIEEQTVQVLENIKMILEEAGTSLDNVVKRNT